MSHDRAVSDVDGEEIAVKVDGEWCQACWKFPTHSVFTAPNGGKVDFIEGKELLYESTDGSVTEMEPKSPEDGVAVYRPADADEVEEIEIHRV